MKQENTKTKGDTAEIAALFFFNRSGYSISIPFGENNPYDLVVESPMGRLYRLQVRWITWKNGVGRISLRQTGYKRAKTMDMSRIEAFVGSDGENIYIVPVSVIGNRVSEFSIRVVSPKNKQSVGINLASDYLEALRFLP